MLLALAACDDGASRAASDIAVAPAAPAAAPRSPAEPATALVLPGVFAPDTTVADLERAFGAAQVQVGAVPGAEGTTQRGVILFAGDPSRRAYVYFEDEQALRGLHQVGVNDAGSQWRLDNGVRIGMSLVELVRRNGRPVRFLGLDWDYGGYVSDWNGGALAPREGDLVRRSVRLAGNGTGEAYPVGDEEFSSDDPRYPRLGDAVQVERIAVSFPGEDDL